MDQMPLFRHLSWTVTVSDLTRYLREALESDELLGDLWVQGEVSNFSHPSSGHVYFTLKDPEASLRCVMWREIARRQPFLPKEGDAIEVHGYISVYELAGQYQLYADALRPLGEGRLYQEFQRLKARLEGEGLFAAERKRPVPAWPRRIGLVTSPTGAALQDILNTLRDRYPLAEVVLAPTPVQGDEAPAGIVAAVQALNRVARPDVILVARGGGSIEDLWAFNDERVAHALAASQAPVITGIGHETDFTIAEFVADLRGPTPTAAAVLATPDQAELRSGLGELGQRLNRAFQSLLASRRRSLDEMRYRLQRNSPSRRIRSDRQRVDDLARRAGQALVHSQQLQRAHLAGLEQRLRALNPLAVLARGFAVVTRQDGRVVRRVAQVQPGDPLHIRVSDGSFGAHVSEAGTSGEPGPD